MTDLGLTFYAHKSPKMVKMCFALLAISDIITTFVA